MTQGELADRCAHFGVKLHPSAIAKMEARDVPKPRAIRLREAVAIAGSLGCGIDDLTRGPEAAMIEVSKKVEAAVFRQGEIARAADEASRYLQMLEGGGAASLGIEPAIADRIQTNLAVSLLALQKSLDEVPALPEAWLTEAARTDSVDLVTLEAARAEMVEDPVRYGNDAIERIELAISRARDNLAARTEWYESDQAERRSSQTLPEAQKSTPASPLSETLREINRDVDVTSADDTIVAFPTAPPADWEPIAARREDPKLYPKGGGDESV